MRESPPSSLHCNADGFSFWIPASSTSGESKVTPEIPSSAAGFDSQVSAPDSEAPKKRCPRHKDNEYIPVAEGRNLCQACYEKEKALRVPKEQRKKAPSEVHFLLLVR